LPLAISLKPEFPQANEIFQLVLLLPAIFSRGQSALGFLLLPPRK
jgi:hypothetical protein